MRLEMVYILRCHILISGIINMTWAIAQKQPLEVFYKKRFCKNLKNSQKRTSARASFLLKFSATLLKKRLGRSCFPMKNNYF